MRPEFDLVMEGFREELAKGMHTKEARISGLTNGERLDAVEQPTLLQGHGAHITGGLIGASLGGAAAGIAGLGPLGRFAGSAAGLVGGARLGGAAARAIGQHGVDEAETPEELERLRTSPLIDHAPLLGLLGGSVVPGLGTLGGGMVGAQVRGERLRHVARAKERMEGGE